MKRVSLFQFENLTNMYKRYLATQFLSNELCICLKTVWIQRTKCKIYKKNRIKETVPSFFYKLMSYISIKIGC